MGLGTCGDVCLRQSRTNNKTPGSYTKTAAEERATRCGGLKPPFKSQQCQDYGQQAQKTTVNMNNAQKYEQHDRNWLERA